METTLQRILQQRGHPLFPGLSSLWFDVYNLPDAWTFPAEAGGVSGFAGLAPSFVIGEHPSWSRWLPEDKGRRLLYDSLTACGAAEAHVTDIIKSRINAHEWKKWSPDLLRPHIELFQREMDELNAGRLILLGGDAQALFSNHFKKCPLTVRSVPHFGALQ